MKSQRILMFGLLIVSLLILGAILLWAPVCDGLLELANGQMVHMKCFYTKQAVALISILIGIQAIASVITKKTNPIMIIGLGVTLIILTYQSFLGIGICMNKAMACHDTALWIRGGGILTIVLGLAAFIKKNK